MKNAKYRILHSQFLILHLIVPIAQSTERARPKRQVVGENPAGDTIFCGCGSTAECGCAKAETTVRFRSPAPSFARDAGASEGCAPKHEVRRRACCVVHCELWPAGQFPVTTSSLGSAILEIGFEQEKTEATEGGQ